MSAPRFVGSEAAALLRERLGLDGVELGRRDRAAVEQALGPLDLGRGRVFAGDGLDVVVKPPWATCVSCMRRVFIPSC
jgi:stage V sporulation protein SpoVS